MMVFLPVGNQEPPINALKLSRAEPPENHHRLTTTDDSGLRSPMNPAVAALKDLAPDPAQQRQRHRGQIVRTQNPA